MPPFACRKFTVIDVRRQKEMDSFYSGVTQIDMDDFKGSGNNIPNIFQLKKNQCPRPFLVGL